MHPVSILQNECGSPVWKRVNKRLSENLWEGEGGVNVTFQRNIMVVVKHFSSLISDDDGNRPWVLDTFSIENIQIQMQMWTRWHSCRKQKKDVDAEK